MIALATSPAVVSLFDLDLLDAIDDAMVVLPLCMIVVALALSAVAWRVVGRPRGLRRLPVDDPYFFPIAETPTIEPRFKDALRFRAWGIPDLRSFRARPLTRNESGGRLARPRSSAAVLTLLRGGRSDV